MGNIVTVAGIRYDVNTGTNRVSVTGFTPDIQPNTVLASSVSFEEQEYPVVSINSNAFENCTILEELTIPASMTNIDNYAFGNCTNLTTIAWENPTLFATIGPDAFLTQQQSIFREPSTVDLSLVTYFNTASVDQLLSLSLKTFVYPGEPAPTIVYNPAPYCFNKGTKILCLNDEYIAVEDLREGNLVKTYLHGYKKIKWIEKGHMRNNPNKWYNCMYIMKKGVNKDLIVTGGHSVLVPHIPSKCNTKNNARLKEQKTIDDLQLLLCSVSPEFQKLKDHNYYTYYHFCLENEGDNDTRYGVWANGVLTETPSVNQWLRNKKKQKNLTRNEKQLHSLNI